MTEMETKIARLPVWAREYIKHLAARSEPLVEEAARCRQRAEKAEEKAKRLSDSNEALLEILQAASRGGSDLAKKIVDILDSYEIFHSHD